MKKVVPAFGMACSLGQKDHAAKIAGTIKWLLVALAFPCFGWAGDLRQSSFDSQVAGGIAGGQAIKGSLQKSKEEGKFGSQVFLSGRRASEMRERLGDLERETAKIAEQFGLISRMDINCTADDIFCYWCHRQYANVYGAVKASLKAINKTKEALGSASEKLKADSELMNDEEVVRHIGAMSAKVHEMQAVLPGLISNVMRPLSETLRAGLYNNPGHYKPAENLSEASALLQSHVNDMDALLKEMSQIAPADTNSRILKELAENLGAGMRKSGKLRIGVVPFNNYRGAESGGSKMVQERLTTFLSENPNVMVLERSVLDRILEEAKLEDILVNDQTRVQFGQMLGVNAIVTGTMLDFSNKNTEVNARVIMAESGQIIAAGQAVLQRTWDETPQK